uniref:K Homology domain-containing protein n=1 Tax=Astatotilapia calliptera TaxID=8154 RepID=A0AAX7SW19_ASTCA
MMAELVQGQASMNQPGLKSEGLADVLQRARQMVGKLGGEGMSHLNSSSVSVEPSLYYPGQKRPGEDGVGNQLAAMGHQRVITEDYKVPDRMVGFIIGRGGEQITRIQLESGCKIQIAPEGGGLMERPCSLTGTPESIEQAKRLLAQIVDRCRNGPGFHGDGEGGASVQEMLIPASKVGLVIGRGGDTIKQLQERAGVKMMMIQDGPMPTGADKPLRISGDPYKVQAARELVLEVIREKDGDFRSGRSDFGARLGGTSLDVPVPRFAVGIVIGRNGEMIKKIQNDAGVRIQFKAGVSSGTFVYVLLHGSFYMLLFSQERDGFGSALRSGRVRGRGDWTMGSPGPLQEVTYTIPADKCGLVIGKGGETIKSINQQSGAHVELQRNPPPSTDPNTRVFTIRGTAQQMDLARQLIDDKIGGSGIMSNGGFGFSPFTQGPAAHQNCGSGQTFLTGVWGNTYQTSWQNPGQQDPGQQNQPQSLMTDYSKAWEDYYKKQSKTSFLSPTRYLYEWHLFELIICIKDTCPQPQTVRLQTPPWPRPKSFRRTPGKVL